MEQLSLLEFNDIRRPTKPGRVGKRLYRLPTRNETSSPGEWWASKNACPPYATWNIKKADWDSFESQEHPIAWSIQWISLASWVLKPTCSLVWLFGNFGGFEASGFKLFQALPLADLALTLFADYAGQLTQRRNHNLPMAC